MLPPTYYRSLLDDDQKVAYRKVVATLLRKEEVVWLFPPVQNIEDVVRAVHQDHPEIWYIDFWSYSVATAGRDSCFRITFRLLIDPLAIPRYEEMAMNAIATMKARVAGLDRDAAYSEVARFMAENIRYRRHDNENGFLYHTAVGALLGESVCEGIAKLYLLYCQHLRLPCVHVGKGKLDGEGHSWNLIETSGGFRHIDVTARLGCPKMLFNIDLFKTDAELRFLGYEWTRNIPAAERRSRFCLTG